ncbi:Myrosinase 1 [Folsomia candida]|uniref:Myrosinase 1 n=2 Tax=Folsomia candida TaxID=158441 RepID=A0A226DHW5_FOLCA|nr:Myrosinase 1 [Folsomia candida]
MSLDHSSHTVTNMRLHILLGFCLVATAFAQYVEEDYFLYDSFPPNFKFGYATASYQIEGGWNEDGKGVNIWDTWTHLNPSPIDDGSNGDLACDSYHKWREDVRILKEAHAKLYRFSISWTRILPNGTYTSDADINPLGVKYYNDLIDALIEAEIEPMITIFHWDTPQSLEDLGGFTNEVIVDHFVSFSRLAFTLFGDRVKHWITFNEPWVVCWQGYGVGSKAPGIVDPAELPYQCVHNILKAHGKTYRLYESDFKTQQRGYVGITLDTYWYEPASDNLNDTAAAERALQFHHGWFASPLYFGKYPDVMREFVDAKSISEGRDVSRLPEFDAEWRAIITGTVDFLGLNHYTSALVRHTNPGAAGYTPGWDGDQDLFKFQSPTWSCSASPWLKVNPVGFRKVLKWLKDTYGSPEIIVTENGTSEDDATAGAFGPSPLFDLARSYYYTMYINNMLKAIVQDGVNITSYTAWSLMDNFEWKRGYTQRFGAHRVEFDDPDRERKPKESVALLRDIFDDNGFNSLRDVNQRKRYHDVVEFYTRGEKPLGQSQGSLSRQVNVAGLAVIMIFWTLIVSLA